MKGMNLVLLSVLATTAGQLLLKKGAVSAGQLSFSGKEIFHSMITLAVQPGIILGAIVFCIGAIIWILALSKTELSKAYPILSLSFVFVSLASYLIFSESLPIQRIIGIMVIISGVALLSRS